MIEGKPMFDVPKITIGIDPGKSGGIAWRGESITGAKKIPETEKDVYELVHWLISEHDVLLAVIESVHSSPQMGVTSAFTFGRNYGVWRGILTALPVRWETITPQKWQKTLGCLTKGDKNVSKAAAQRLFPTAGKITHATADALLIAEYAWRMEMTRTPTP